jgi:hypothetical protein
MALFTIVITMLIAATPLVVFLSFAFIQAAIEMRRELNGTYKAK